MSGRFERRRPAAVCSGSRAPEPSRKPNHNRRRCGSSRRPTRACTGRPVRWCSPGTGRRMGQTQRGLVPSFGTADAAPAPRRLVAPSIRRAPGSTQSANSPKETPGAARQRPTRSDQATPTSTQVRGTIPSYSERINDSQGPRLWSSSTRTVVTSARSQRAPLPRSVQPARWADGGG